MIRRLRCVPPLGVGLLAALWLLVAGPAWAQQAGQGTAAPPAPLSAPLAAPAKAAAPALAPPSSLRCRYLRLATGRDTTSFALADTLTIVPASVTAAGHSVAYDARTDRYQLVRPAPRDSSGAPLADSVLLCYRVLPMQLLRARFRRPRGLMDSLDFRDRAMLTVADFSQKEQILSTPGISKTGNLSRGISFGNTQNVFVNSALNLQLEGKLTENIRLTAAISDQNVPFQPEGNTQTLQQFDKIYITLTGPQWNLTAGDVVLRNKPDYFLRYYKNIQGAAVEVNLGAPGPQPLQAGATNNSVSNAPPSSFTTYTNGVTNNSAAPVGNSQPTLATPSAAVPGGPQLTAAPGAPGAPPAGSGSVTVLDKLGQVRSSTLVAGGVAKGKFASIDLAPLENVQGPYRLTGPNGEQYIIVLAGSERVYIDGRLQARGFDYDYTIDYNLAEITFSTRHLITSNTRLKVDFEYSDLNYSRSLYTLSHYQQVGKLNVRGNFYQEADDPNNAANLTLSASDQQLLRAAGNVSQVQVAASRTDSAAYSRSLVQYHRVAFLNAVTGQSAYKFVYATDSLSGVYTVSFTDVGAGLGDYNLSTTNANTNGRVYDYAGPGLGRYKAIRILPTPLLKQMVSGGATYQLDPTASVFVDVASSQIQRNRFAVGTEDTGGAVRLGYAVQDRALPGWAPAALQKYRLRSAFDFEHTAPKFAPIDRYRDIEFDRNWSTTSTANATATDPREDNIVNFAVGLTRDASHSINYRFSHRYRPGEVDGQQHWLDVAQRVGRVELRGALFLLNSQAGRYHSDWARGEVNVRYGGGRLIPGYTYKFDKNRVVSPQGDTITSANYFDEHTFYLQSPDTGRTHYRLDYSYRRDQTPTAEQRNLQVHTVSQTWQGNLTTRLSKYQDLRIIATYRDLNLVSTPDSARQRNILGKIDHTLGLLQNQIRSELSYSVQTGRELRRDYSFVAVPAGQGTHYYAGDLNHNGVQDKDEFLEAQTADAQYRTYIKVYLPTTDYITAYQNRLSYRLTVAAPRGWRDAGTWKSALARLSSVSSVTIDRRTTSPDILARLSPFNLSKDGDKVLAFNQLMRNTLYFNRANPIFGAELTVQQTQQKTLLTYGFDLRNLSTQSLLLRRTLAQSFTGRLNVARDIREALTDYTLAAASTSARNYRLLIYTVQPEVSYQPSPALRVTGSLLHTHKQNVLDITDAELHPATFDDLGLETRLSQVSKRTLTAATHITRVDFDGDVSSVVGLEILQALRPGTNYTWNLNLEQRLANGLNINVAYDGRKASGVGVVHTGRMQVAVLF